MFVKGLGPLQKQQQPLTKTLARTELIHQHRDLTLNRSLSYILILCVEFVMFGFLHAFNGSAQLIVSISLMMGTNDVKF